MLLFLANYPNQDTWHEGMSQRIVAMDQQFKAVARTYLFVSYRLFARKEVEKIADGVVQYRCNLFIHFFLILKLIRNADTLFFHSVINVLPVLPLFLFIHKKSKLILDAHGVVPEEIKLSGLAFKSFLYSLSERIVFKRVDVVIVVTHTMENHFKAKYLSSRPTFLHYTILPSHLYDKEINIEIPTDVVELRVVYSGNTQSWQNIELMLETIKNNDYGNIRFDILTGEPEQMKKLLAKFGLQSNKRIHVQTVDPKELDAYYHNAHYGFVLRDDITVNHVACPTKMVEYLFYGIIPIVKSPKIGDFEAMGYEYLCYKDFSVDLIPTKSETNHKLIQELLAINKNKDLFPLVKHYG
ncbi:hypothetical protein [Parapedobacter tibetensis]|uniref:hypothetical protein n=1 Tax=Parapedobacter tibetensis TaxID=2972951 RepID=UPI00214DDBAD|nr:hypothetical protein [Parapedobacter tibetensis]